MLKRIIVASAVLLFSPTAALAVISDTSYHATQTWLSLEEGSAKCMGGHYVRSDQHDSFRFAKFFDAAPGHQVMRASYFPYPQSGSFAVTASIRQPTWVFSRFLTPDSDTFTLKRPSIQLARRLSQFSIVPPSFVPNTMRGIGLGDSSTKITGIFGVGKPYYCGELKLFAYAWPAQFGDAFVTYGVDRGDRIEYIQAGTGEGGIRHLWESSPFRKP